jgi:hypothetical protein
VTIRHRSTLIFKVCDWYPSGVSNGVKGNFTKGDPLAILFGLTSLFKDTKNALGGCPPAHCLYPIEGGAACEIMWGKMQAATTLLALLALFLITASIEKGVRSAVCPVMIIVSVLPWILVTTLTFSQRDRPGGVMKERRDGWWFAGGGVMSLDGWAISP